MNANGGGSGGGKFQKWKMEMIWYEGQKSSIARISFKDESYMERIYNKLKNIDKIK